MHRLITGEFLVLLASFTGALPGKRSTQSTSPPPVLSLGSTTSSGIASDTPSPFPRAGSLPHFFASGVWVTASCDTKDTSLTFEDQWTAADGEEAWTQALDAYKTDLNTPGLSANPFDNWLWTTFNRPSFPRCFDPGSSSNCNPQECQEGKTPPAAALMMDSIVGLHTVMSLIRDAMNSAKINVLGAMGMFRESFTELPDTSSEALLKVLLDALIFGIGMMSAVGWNLIISSMTSLSSELRGGLKDMSNSAISFGFAAGKDSLKAGSKDQAIQDLLTGVAAQYMDATTDGLNAFLSNIINATDAESQDFLTDIVTAGIGYEFQGLSITDVDLQGSAEQLFFGRLMGVAWDASVVEMSPFILRVDRLNYTCGDPVANAADGFPLESYMSEDTASKTQWCDADGNTFFLLNAQYGRISCVTNPLTGECIGVNFGDNYFGALAGGTSDELDGSNWGGITLEDIITSSYGGFLANGNKNGYEMAPGSSLQANSELTEVTDGDIPFTAGIRTPGFWNFTVCFDPQEAADNILADIRPVCGETPRSLGMTAPDNEEGYAPGVCSVHVTQYQRNRDNANPVEEWTGFATSLDNTNPLSISQLAVTIADAANDPMVFATKQPLDPALLIPSNLIHDFIVSVGDADEDPVCFWYGSQYWCSDDTSDDHKCGFGNYDDDTHKREGDCAFLCDDSTINDSSPPTPPPSDPVTAFLGTGTPPLSVGNEASYVAGTCGLHIRHYQRDEESNYMNMGDYSLELTLRDNDGTLVSYTPKTYSPTGQDTAIQGPLEWLVLCQTGAEDDDPISCRYSVDHWVTDDDDWCSQGGYDGGKRDIDCQFPC